MFKKLIIILLFLAFRVTNAMASDAKIDNQDLTVYSDQVGWADLPTEIKKEIIKLIKPDKHKNTFLVSIDPARDQIINLSHVNKELKNILDDMLAIRAILSNFSIDDCDKIFITSVFDFNSSATNLKIIKALVINELVDVNYKDIDFNRPAILWLPDILIGFPGMGSDEKKVILEIVVKILLVKNIDVNATIDDWNANNDDSDSDRLIDLSIKSLDIDFLSYGLRLKKINITLNNNITGKVRWLREPVLGYLIDKLNSNRILAPAQTISIISLPIELWSDKEILSQMIKILK